MSQILGVEVTNKAIVLSLIHNVVEIVGMTAWLSLVLSGEPVLGFVVLAATLTIEHILALAPGKIA